MTTGTPQPVAFAGSFQLASDPSLPQDPIPFNYSGQFTALVATVEAPSASGTINVPFGTIIAPGAKGLLIRYDAAQPTGAQPVMVTINSGSAPLELTPGSLLVYFNANPVSGITACSIAVTAACQLRVWLLQ
jgi:hypothetical protein